MQAKSFTKVSPIQMSVNPSSDPSTNRRTPRRSYERLVGILCHGHYSVEQAVQIGEGGMMIVLPTELKAGDLILITLIFPKTLETLVGRAEVLYKGEKVSNDRVHTGVKFLNLATIKRRAIRDFVSAKPAFDNKESRNQQKAQATEIKKLEIKKAS